MRIEYGLKTHIGRLRTLNEDACAVAAEGRYPHFAVVCDGMGGHEAGEIASSLAVRTIVESMHRAKSVDMREIRRAIEVANSRVYRHAISHEGCSGMGTTLVMAVIDGNSVYVANVGDSRAYRFSSRESKLIQISTDHSLLEELLSSGQLLPEDAENFPFKNIITRAVGSSEEVKIDLFEINWEKGDMLLLCSDGLNRHVNDEEILNKILEAKAKEKNINEKSAEFAQALCEELVDHANQAGGRDNITVSIAYFCEGGAE